MANEHLNFDDLSDRSKDDVLDLLLELQFTGLDQPTPDNLEKLDSLKVAAFACNLCKKRGREQGSLNGEPTPICSNCLNAVVCIGSDWLMGKRR